MQTKHTPGPWRLTESGDAIVSADGGTLIVETGQDYWKNLEAAAAGASSDIAKRHLPQVRANARLIAAAPELLEALVAILETADLSFGEGEQAAKVGNAVISQARAAIEKANGKDHPPATPDRGEFDGYKVSLSCDPAYYGSECTDADAERIFGKLSELIRSQFPGIQVARWDDTRRSSATTGPDEAVCDEIHQWISDNWTKAL